ncbi:winged helix-turn-helix transcriptional regulator [Natrialbaceae archaeon A-arb3/5]
MTENPIPEDTDRQTSSEDARCYCPLGGVMDLLSKKYAIQVICVVGALQPVRYGEIEDAFGDVSSSTLSTRLSELTDANLLEREQHDTIPPQVEYALTADGTDLCELLEPLVQWVENRSESE